MLYFIDLGSLFPFSTLSRCFFFFNCLFFFCSPFSCFTTMSSRSLINLSASSNMLWFPLVCLHFNYCSLRLWLALFYICISLLMFSMTFVHFTLISVIFMTISLNSLYDKLPISIYLFIFCSFWVFVLFSFGRYSFVSSFCLTLHLFLPAVCISHIFQSSKTYRQSILWGPVVQPFLVTPDT